MWGGREGGVVLVSVRLREASVQGVELGTLFQKRRPGAKFLRPRGATYLLVLGVSPREVLSRVAHLSTHRTPETTGMPDRRDFPAILEAGFGVEGPRPPRPAGPAPHAT